MLVKHINKNFLKKLEVSKKTLNVAVGAGRAFDPIPPSVKVAKSSAGRPLSSDLFYIHSDRMAVERRLVTRRKFHGKSTPNK